MRAQMGQKAQAAMEYITTYGWAVLVVVIVGVVLWQMGFFDFSSRISPHYSGFSILVPIDWEFTTTSPTTCSLSVVFSNGAGEDLSSVAVLGGDTCIPSDLPPGETTVCTKTPDICPSPGKAYRQELVVTYRRSSDNQSFQTAGIIWGNAV